MRKVFRYIPIIRDRVPNTAGQPRGLAPFCYYLRVSVVSLICFNRPLVSWAKLETGPVTGAIRGTQELPGRLTPNLIGADVRMINAVGGIERSSFAETVSPSVETVSTLVQTPIRSEFSKGGTQSAPTRKICVLGVPLDLGASRRGVDMGPSAVRVAGLEARLEALGHQVSDGGNIRVEIAETQSLGNVNARYLKQIAETCTRTAEAVLKSLEDGMSPLVLGGDHSLAAGTVAGVAEFYRRRGERIGVIWMDAHSDINTPETSPSGNVHGMPLAALLGLGLGSGLDPLSQIFGYSPKIAPENTVLVGVRDIDVAERENIRQAGVGAVYTMRDIDERGMRTVMEEAVRVASQGTAGYHVSLDMDWIDPEDAPGVGTPVRGGATYREAHLAMEILADHGRLLSFEIVEVNPVIDEHNRTADLAVELACSAFGKKIL